jgi:hypothetical protein
LFGAGVYRVDVATQTASLLAPGFNSDLWLDLATEDEDTILGVGASLGGGPGVYRIDATTAVATPLSVGAPWVMPVAVARAPGGVIDLSLRDVRILELLYRQRGSVVDRQTFFAECWDLNFMPNSRTLRGRSRHSTESRSSDSTESQLGCPARQTGFV